MTEPQDLLAAGATYLNPVYDRSCPDPFVLKFGGEYWTYCTGFWHDGRVFGVLHSRDLVNWRELGGAMEPLPEGTLPVPLTCYWAPEVVYEQGRFLMYYSLGNEARMEIRVAVAAHPAGPFADSGRSLTKEEFAIDAHVFVDTDGSRHLFYATDFLTHTHIGTGIVRDRMLDAFTLEGEPRAVTRARFDWQVYDPQRMEKGGVRWHTVEGPSVLKHKGRYYEMFSGGNWQNTTYGVSFATTENIDTPDEWEQVADGERVLPILRTIPGKVTGPGHNSVVRGPDNRQLFCAYHLWTENGRVLAIDRLDWVGERMIVLGPTTTPQLAPIAPTFADFFDDERVEGLGDGWKCIGGRWKTGEGEALQEDAEAPNASAACPLASSSFAAEVYLRALSENGGAFGLLLSRGGEPVLSFEIEPGKKEAKIVRLTSEKREEKTFPLPTDFNPRAFHLVRLETDEGRARLRLDDWALAWEGRVVALPDELALITRLSSAAFKGFALTAGWEDLFTEHVGEPREAGWHVAEGNWQVCEGQLQNIPSGEARSLVTKGPLLESYELVVNARLDADISDGDAGYGFCTAYAEDGGGPALVLRRAGAGWALQLRGDGVRAGDFPLPASFDPFIHQHFRFIKLGGRLLIKLENESLGVVEVPEGASRVGLSAGGVKVSFDLVRVTMIKGIGTFEAFTA